MKLRMPILGLCLLLLSGCGTFQQTDQYNATEMFEAAFDALAEKHGVNCLDLGETKSFIQSDEALNRECTKYGLSVDLLDENERLVFWLGGQPVSCLEEPFFDFEKSRLLDQDGDRWLEYGAGNGWIYSLNNGRVELNNVSATPE